MSKVTMLIEGLKSLPDKKITLQDVINSLSETGFPFVLLTWAVLLMAVPIPKIPPVNFFFAMPFVFIGWQMLIGKDTPSMPSWLQGKKVQGRFLRAAAQKIERPLQRVESLARPHWLFLSESRHIGNIMGANVLLMTVSILLPLPCTDTPAAFFIALMCLGKIYQDGRLIFAGIIGGCLWIIVLFLALEKIIDVISGMWL